MACSLQLPGTAACIGIAAVTILAVRRVVKYFTSGCPSKALMTGKTVIVTGANCGIGFETALDLAQRQAHVILACRDMTKGQKAVDSIIMKTGNKNVELKHLDLESFKSVRAFCEDVKSSLTKLDVLVNNAAMMGVPYKLTEDGIETQFSANHFGNFLLTNLLLKLLEKAESGRIVFVSAKFHTFGKVDLENFNSLEAYKNGRPSVTTKLWNLLFARELHRRLADDGKITVNSVHPGMVRTEMGRHMFISNIYFKIFCFPLYALFCFLNLLIIKSAKEGCQPVVYCVVAPELEGHSDGYYGTFKKEPWSAAASDLGLAKKVYDVSARVTGLEN